MESLLRRSRRPMAAISTPSIKMVPPAGSTSLNRATPNDDLPADASHRVGRTEFCSATTHTLHKKPFNSGRLTRTRPTHYAKFLPSSDGEIKSVQDNGSVVSVPHFVFLESDCSIFGPAIWDLSFLYVSGSLRLTGLYMQ